MPLHLPHTRAITNCATTYNNNYNSVGIIIVIIIIVNSTLKSDYVVVTKNLLFWLRE